MKPANSHRIVCACFVDSSWTISKLEKKIVEVEEIASVEMA